MVDKKIEKKEDKKLSFLENDNSVTLQGGKVIFAGFKNWQRNDAYIKACNDKGINSLNNKDDREYAKENKINEWLIAWVIQNGNSFLKGETIEKTFINIQNLNDIEATIIGTAVGEFIALRESEIIKKSR